jgi:hypothetical protein
MPDICENPLLKGRNKRMRIFNQHQIPAFANPLIMTINTDLGAGTTFTLPLPSGQTYDFWWNPGDGSPDLHVIAYNDANKIYDYGTSFNGQISIGTQPGDKCGGWSFNNGGDKLKVTSIDQWGDIGLDYTTGFFYGCSNIVGDLTIPEILTSIGNNAFDDCSGFNGNLTIPSSVTSIGVNAFRNCSGLTGDLTIPNSVTSIGSQAFYNCYGFNGNLTISSSVTSIEFFTFRGCYSLTGNLTIPSSVTSIGGYAFYNCLSLTGNITIPGSVTSIGDYAFYNCSNLTGDLTIPSSVTSIGISAFRGCYSLTGNLTIPSSVTNIGNNAFDNCSGFNGNLTIPSSITSIGDYAFQNCSNLIRVDSYPLTAPTVGTDGLLLGGTPRPLHIQTSGTSGYGVSPWTDTGIFSSIIDDL